MKPLILTGIVVLTAGLSGLFAQAPAPKGKSNGERKAAIAIESAYKANDPDGMIKAAENLLNNYADSDFKEFALSMEATAYRYKHDDENAQIFADRVLQINPKAYAMELLIAEAITSNIKEHDLNYADEIDKCTKLFSDVIENAKAAPKPNAQDSDADWERAKKRAIAEAHNGLGMLAQVQKKPSDAIKEFQVAVDNDPEADEYSARLARAFLVVGKSDECVAICDKLLAKPGLNPQIKTYVTSVRDLVTKRPAPQVNTASTAGLTVHDTVERIKSGAHSPMPPAVRSPVSANGGTGPTTMTVKNSTAYGLSVYFDGPVAKKLILAAGASQDVELAPGVFHVAGSVAAADVLPFYGEDTYASSAQYSMTFYIGQ
jgi:tetratricopeptide (TPR) repeat protein